MVTGTEMVYTHDLHLNGALVSDDNNNIKYNYSWKNNSMNSKSKLSKVDPQG